MPSTPDPAEIPDSSDDTLVSAAVDPADWPAWTDEVRYGIGPGPGEAA